MADAWLVHDPGVDNFNQILLQAVKSCRGIIDEVEQVLASMPGAAQTSALSPWHDLKLQWTNAYNNMLMSLQSASGAGQGAQDAYRWGDLQSYRIMA